jgi:DNA-binding beta-propeller fold protein YncE
VSVPPIRIVALLLAAFLLASAARWPYGDRATGRIAGTAWPYFPGSLLPLTVQGFAPPYRAVLLGPGTLDANDFYEVPAGAGGGEALLVAGNAAGLAAKKLRIATPPASSRALLVVASYDDGLVVHDARTFAVLGVLATGGSPSDAVADPHGRIAAPDTQGSTLTVATLSPWSVARISGVPVGDEVAIDASTGAIFVTDRDFGGGGALTRVAADGGVTHVSTGETAEGLAVDERRQIVYVANANDGTVAAVDARSMRVLRKFFVVNRIFSLALSPDGTRLYGISNQSAGSLFAAAGSAVAIAVNAGKPHVVARSRDLAFPLGAVLDSKTATLFVTDESLATIDVLDARTLRAKHEALRTCSTPWKPSFDPMSGRLYVPCASSNAIDVIDTRTLRRVAGAPFPTGSYPLAVAIWPSRK